MHHRLALACHPAGGSSPASPSTASRSRSAWPVCRPYSSIRSQRSRRRLAWRPSGEETWTSWSSPPSAKAASSLERDRSTAPSHGAPIGCPLSLVMKGESEVVGLPAEGRAQAVERTDEVLGLGAGQRRFP